MKQSTTVGVVFIANLLTLHFTAARYAYNSQQLVDTDGSLHSDSSADDALTYSELDDVIKRDGGKGTCTCTCETKPAGVAAVLPVGGVSPVTAGIQHKPLEKYVPQSANLMRTAANTKTKTTQQAVSRPVEPASEAAATKAGAAAATFGDYGGLGIVRVPPIEDYVYNHDTAADSSDELDHFDDSLTQHQQPNSGNNKWIQDSRFPWKQLPDTMCLREMCESDSDCCLRFNICDRSAHVCVDCWYGSSCSSDADCCLKYPRCKLSKDRSGTSGKCTNEL